MCLAGYPIVSWASSQISLTLLTFFFFFGAGRETRIFYLKAKGKKQRFQRDVGIIMVKQRFLDPNDSHTSHPQKENETELMLGLFCLSIAWDTGVTWDPQHRAMGAQPKGRCSAHERPGSIPSAGNDSLLCFHKLKLP